MPSSPTPPPDPLAVLRSPSFLSELRRKAIHLSLFVLPLDLLFEVLPWPRGRGQWTLLLLVLAFGALRPGAGPALPHGAADVGRSSR